MHNLHKRPNKRSKAETCGEFLGKEDAKFRTASALWSVRTMPSFCLGGAVVM